MAGATGLEPATFGVTGRRSNQTELRPRNKNVYIDIRRSLQAFFFTFSHFFELFPKAPEKPDIRIP